MNKTVHIPTARAYDVTIGAGLMERAGELIKRAHGPCRAAVISDSNVAPLYLERCEKSLRNAGFDTASYVFPAGERSKSLATLSDILEFLASAGLTRSDLVVALGGGVTGDMAGFAAAVYQRGIAFAQVPTTLLAAVDSSVGGKTAVNLAAGKNLAGAFWQPVAVVCDTDTLNTLTPEVFADGAAEAIKYGILCDRALFSGFGDDARPDIDRVIARAVEIKSEYVVGDERDHGTRSFLNLGHTMAHAIEKLSGYTFPHGHAVAVGTVMIARAGERLGVTSPGTAEALTRVYEKNGLPVAVSYGAEELYRAALGDKKRSGGDITLVMIEEIGKCFLKKLPVAELRPLVEVML